MQFIIEPIIANYILNHTNKSYRTAAHRLIRRDKTIHLPAIAETCTQCHGSKYIKHADCFDRAICVLNEKCPKCHGKGMVAVVCLDNLSLYQATIWEVYTQWYDDDQIDRIEQIINYELEQKLALEQHPELVEKVVSG